MDGEIDDLIERLVGYMIRRPPSSWGQIVNRFLLRLRQECGQTILGGRWDDLVEVILPQWCAAIRCEAGHVHPWEET